MRHGGLLHEFSEDSMRGKPTKERKRIQMWCQLATLQDWHCTSDVRMALLDHTASRWVECAAIHTADLHHLINDFLDAGASASAHAVMCCQPALGTCCHCWRCLMLITQSRWALRYEYQAARADGLHMLPLWDLYANLAIAVVLHAICVLPNGPRNIRLIWRLLGDLSAIVQHSD